MLIHEMQIQEQQLRKAKEFLIRFLGIDPEMNDEQNKNYIGLEIDYRKCDMKIALEYLLKGKNTNKDDRFFDQYYQMDTFKAFISDAKTIQIIVGNLYYKQLLTI